MPIGTCCNSWAEFEKRKALAISSLADSGKWGFLQAQGVLVSDQPAMPDGAKVAHMYPGQGSQYVGMTHDLHERYTPVQDVWNASDSTMVEVLDGETLSSFVLRSGLSDEERKAAEHKLKQTEYTQPAMLTADLAIEHALNAYGHEPDMVAGHSLGEYAALMASGILNMDGALRAAAARGTEMGSVEIDDKGLMASVTAPYDAVERILDAAEGYVIAANKNSPKMTVIAGATQAVQDVMKALKLKDSIASPWQPATLSIRASLLLQTNRCEDSYPLLKSTGRRFRSLQTWMEPSTRMTDQMQRKASFQACPTNGLFRRVDVSNQHDVRGRCASLSK